MLHSACGYSQMAHRQREEGKQRQNLGTASRGHKDWSRRVPYAFTTCLAHVEITERCGDGEVTMIAGHFDHNEACHKSILTRLPAIPLHNHVYEVALSQLQDGARYALINLGSVKYAK